MPSTPWATHPQLVFLESRLTDFLKAQGSKNLPAFWIEVKRDFFIRWPDQTAEAESSKIDPLCAESSKKSKKASKKREEAPPNRAPQTHYDWVVNRKTVRLNL